ncbi:MAG: hypothetical protein HYV60_20810, partial [Planctomycetia bacterium]|nr:hypothetical protein [Planctomycetia bacterium]
MNLSADQPELEATSRPGTSLVRGMLLRVLFVFGLLLGTTIAQFALTGSRIDKLQLQMQQFRVALMQQQEPSAESAKAELEIEEAGDDRKLLAGLEAIVSAYEGEMNTSLQALQIARIAVFIGTLCTLGLAGIGVFWPMSPTGG